MFVSPQNSCFDIVNPKIMVLGDMVSGAWLGQKSRTFMNRIHLLIKETTESPLPLVPQEYTMKGKPSANKEVNFQQNWNSQHFGLGRSSHQNWEKCLLLNHSVYGTLLQQPELRHQAFLFTGLLFHFGEAYPPESSEEIF